MTFAARAPQRRTVEHVSYPSNLLNDGETVHTDLHPHWSTLISGCGPLAGMLALTILLAASSWLSGLVAYVVLALWLAAAVWCAMAVIRYLTTEFVVTSSRIIFRRGLLTQASTEIPLDRVTNTSLTRSLLERLLGDGDLVVESAGRDGQSVFSDIPDPERVSRLIHQLVDSRQVPGTQVSADTGTAHSLADQLERLAALHASGALNDAEFDAAKARLLHPGS
jgi:uncharacterized membrane protein YdbT with pleckstrin-like domain